MKHFTIEEFTSSVTARAKGLDNTPTEEHRQHIEEMVTLLLDPLREAWAIRCAREQLGTPRLKVSSGYRSFQLNQAVGGSATSAHCVGYAADLMPMNGRLAEFKKFCREWLAGRDFDQLISEDEDANRVPVWVHIGYRNTSGQQRRQMLSKRAVKNAYTPITA